MTNVPNIDPIKYLLARRFGRPAIDPSSFAATEVSPNLAAKILEYRAYLEGLSDHHLSKLCREEEARALYDEHMFPRQADADFDYWARMPNWSVDEALALSLGKAPERVSWSIVKGLIALSSIAAEYGRRVQLATRCVASSQLSDPMLPSTFIEWADQVGIALPLEMRTALDAWAAREPSRKARYEELTALVSEKEARIAQLTAELLQAKADLETAQAKICGPDDFGTKQRQSMLAMIAGMAIHGYKFKPTAAKNTAPKEISVDIEEIGLSLHPETVLEYLRMAAAFRDEKAEKKVD